MLNRSYFESDLPQLVRELGEDVTVDMHLLTGEILNLFRVDAVREEYVLLTVLPPSGVNSAEISLRMKPDTDRILFDRMAVPYRQISHVRVSTAQVTPAPRSLVSFKASAGLEER